MKSQTYTLLVHVVSAILNPEQDHIDLRTHAEEIKDWRDIALQAERHGLSVILGQLAKKGVIEIPRDLDLQLKALTIRHQKIQLARNIVLKDVGELFNAHQIQFALLKGAALSHLIYSPSWLRPMRDIDLIVHKKDAARAQRLLRNIGFMNEDANSGYLFEHHHLPNSTRTQDGFCVSLEVHYDALSGDVNHSICLDNLTTPLRSFKLEQTPVFAFSHFDTLNHLCHHTFEPASIIKLGSILDLALYAHTYIDEIDWPQLKNANPNIINTLRCINALVLLPPKLIDKLGEPLDEQWKPLGLGEGFAPLSQISKLPGMRNKLHALLAPSPWWMHIFYGVEPEHSLLKTKVISHPISLTKWFYRRFNAARKSRAN